MRSKTRVGRRPRWISSWRAAPCSASPPSAEGDVVGDARAEHAAVRRRREEAQRRVPVDHPGVERRLSEGRDVREREPVARDEVDVQAVGVDDPPVLLRPRHDQADALDDAAPEPTAAGARPLEEREQRARRGLVVAEVEVVGGRLVVIDRALDQPEPEVPVETCRPPSVRADGGDVMQGRQPHPVNVKPCARFVESPSKQRSRQGPNTRMRGRSSGGPRACGRRTASSTRVTDRESEGIGVRVLVGGAWGFACDRRLSDEGARAAARRAVEFARAAGGSQPLALAPAEPHTGRFATPVERDPFAVPLSEKIELLLRADEAMKHDSVAIRTGSVRAQREQQGLRLLGRRRDRARARRVRRRDRRARGLGGRRPDPQLSERPRRLERAGGLGARRGPRARARGAARGRAGRRAPPRRPVPGRPHDRRDRRRADAAPGARVGGPSDRARPRLRHRGRVRGHELPQARGSRLAALRLRAHEHHRRLDHAARARHLRLGRRGRAGAPRADRRGGRPPRLPDLTRDGRTDRRGRRRLDARRRLEPDAARPDDEPPPRAGARARSRSCSRTWPRGSSSRRTRAGRSTTSG